MAFHCPSQTGGQLVLALDVEGHSPVAEVLFLAKGSGVGAHGLDFLATSLVTELRARPDILMTCSDASKTGAVVAASALLIECGFVER